ncbi:OmpA family protein [Parasulfitobacter algicola]|uniref:OmpA family protein n=1 Tax=Parasulfitobacter algicola TaxID=2614809 RepID=A0ABX2ITS4_9RHOB|nr:OmpA family protein [Sulfitobacter algicola]
MAAPATAETDKTGSSDHPLLSRYPGFYIDDYKSREFDRAQMISSAMIDGTYEMMTVDGQVTNIEYRSKDGSISGFQLYANYQKAMQDLNADIIFTCFGEDECGAKGNDFYNKSVNNNGLFGGSRIDFFNDFGIITAKAEQNGQQAHIMLVMSANTSNSRRIFQTIVTGGTLEVDKIGIGSIEDVSAKLVETGTVVLEGIYFDTGTADLTSESNETLDTAAAYLAANPEQQFFIVGHTDWVGGYDMNMSLSEARAKSVVMALQERGIETGRLTGLGVGPVSPVANNSEEAGRALNRRVELVLRE